jgi:hypothetical protein
MLLSLRLWLHGEVVNIEAGVAFGFGLFLFCFGALGIWINVRYVRANRASLMRAMGKTLRRIAGRS